MVLMQSPVMNVNYFYRSHSDPKSMFSYAVPPPLRYENSINGNSIFSKSLRLKTLDFKSGTFREAECRL